MSPRSPKALALLGADPSAWVFGSNIQCCLTLPHHPSRALVKHRITRGGKDLDQVAWPASGRGLPRSSEDVICPVPFCFPDSVSFVLVPSLPLEYAGPAPEAALNVRKVKGIT